MTISHPCHFLKIEGVSLVGDLNFKSGSEERGAEATATEMVITEIAEKSST